MRTKALLCKQNVIMMGGSLGFSKGKIYIAYESSDPDFYHDKKSTWYTLQSELAQADKKSYKHWLPDDFIEEYFTETTAGNILYGTNDKKETTRA